MSLMQKVKDNEERTKKIAEYLKLAEQKKKPFKPFKIPRHILRQKRRKEKQGMILTLYLKNNHNADIEWAKEEAGIIDLNNKKYGFDNTAVYFYKKQPLIILPEWRLIPLGGERDKTEAAKLGIQAFGEQTVIRAIEKTEVEREDKKKKKGKIGIVWWLIGIAIAIYLLTRLMGG